jgi:hypothetical protein
VKLLSLKRYGWTDAPQCHDSDDSISNDDHNSLKLSKASPPTAQPCSRADSTPDAFPSAACYPHSQTSLSQTPAAGQCDVSGDERERTSWRASSRANGCHSAKDSRGDAAPLLICPLPLLHEPPLRTHPPLLSQRPRQAEPPLLAPRLVVQWTLPADAKCALGPRRSGNSFDSRYSARAAASTRLSEPRAALSARASLFIGSGRLLSDTLDAEPSDAEDGPRRGSPYFLFRSAAGADAASPPSAQASPTPPARHGALSPLCRAARMFRHLWPVPGSRPPSSRAEPAPQPERRLARPAGHRMASKYNFHELQCQWEASTDNDFHLISGDRTGV